MIEQEGATAPLTELLNSGEFTTMNINPNTKRQTTFSTFPI